MYLLWIVLRVVVWILLLTFSFTNRFGTIVLLQVVYKTSVNYIVLLKLHLFNNISKPPFHVINLNKRCTASKIASLAAVTCNGYTVIINKSVYNSRLRDWKGDYARCAAHALPYYHPRGTAIGRETSLYFIHVMIDRIT